MRVIRMLSLCGLAAACERNLPVAPERGADPPVAVAPATLSAAELAELAAAIADAQAWLLPSPAADAATQALAGPFADLATSLKQAETSDALTTRIAAVREELDALAADPAADRYIELAALGLVLDGVEAVIQGRLRLVPFDAAAPNAPPDAPGSANEPNRTTVERSLP
jgi:hypothetical protein